MQTVRLSEEKQEVFENLQAKYAEYRKQLVITTSKLSQADMERKRNKLTLFELDKLPEGTATFKAVGKMFISVPSADIVQECKSSAEDAESRVSEFTAQKTALERAVQEVEAELRGILTSARENAD